MASNTRNVKLGVCYVYFDGIDLGYTKGGVEVQVTTETYKSTVDQFGQAPINELIMGREVKVTCPLAETTLENMVEIMPGATLVNTGGAKASGTILIATNPTNSDTIIINGVTITFKTAATSELDVTIGGTAAATATALQALLQASTHPSLAVADYTVNTATVTVTYRWNGTEGNAYTLNAGTAGVKVTLSGATLTGGTEPTAKRVNVTDGVGTDLLSIAKELRLHPKGKAITDKSEDFVIPLAATPGALTFAYKLDEERVFNVEFTGYPASDGKVFHFGT